MTYHYLNHEWGREYEDWLAAEQASLSEIAVTGGHNSLTNRMNYYLEFSKTDGLFLTKEVIEQHNMFCNNAISDISFATLSS